jgi:DNA-binding CsgD family transcriptional regulator
MPIVAEDYYKKSIAISEIYKSHLDLVPDVYRKLSELYYDQGQYKMAHDYINTFSQLNEIQFGSRSMSNQGLLEIKDDFRMEMERQNRVIREQELANLEQVNQNRNLQLLILFVSLLSFIFIGLLIYRNLRAKHKAEKKLLERQKEMEAQKNLEVIEVKNKELTTSALHIIEKEELLSETKNQLVKQKDNPNPSEINKVIKRIKLSTNHSWKEFELRFLQVNKDFYHRLREKHGNLSQNDHKICALVKLNFSSKDMSTLLGISIESVHTTRYRLRKKMGLDRHVNLEDYIANI